MSEKTMDIPQGVENRISRSKNPLGHPASLLFVSGAEMWERFSFYAIQAILLYFIYYSTTDGGLGLDQSVGLAVVGGYGGLVYLLQPMGAWLADRVMQIRFVLLVGALIIMAGHIALSFAVDMATLIVGLAMIAIGTGLLMPNALTVVGHMYADNRTKQDSGYSLFYGAILIGALAGPVVAGLLQTRVSFQAAFFSAAVGMALGIVVYLSGWKYLPKTAREIPNPLAKNALNRIFMIGVLLIAGATVIAYNTLNVQNLNAAILSITSIIVILVFATLLLSKSNTRIEKQRVAAYVPIFVTCALFWSLILQLFTTFAVYADTRVHMVIGRFEVPPAFISTFEVIAGILFTVPIALLWQKLGARQPNTSVKVALGAGVMVAAFSVFALLSYVTDDLISIYPVIIGMVIFGVSEILCAPLFYSLTQQSSPKAHKSQMMALNGLSMSVGASLSGFIGSWYVTVSNESIFFLFCAGMAFSMGAIMLLFYPLHRRLGVGVAVV